MLRSNPMNRDDGTSGNDRIGELSRRLIKLLVTRPYSMADAALTLGVPERRIQMIREISEGAGLVHSNQGLLCLKKGMLDPKLDPSTTSSPTPTSQVELHQLEGMSQRCLDLDKMLQGLEDELILQKKIHRSHSFVTHSDLRSCMNTNMLIVIGAQKDAQFTVMESDCGQAQRNKVNVGNKLGKPMTTFSCLCPRDNNIIAQRLGQDNEKAKEGYYPITPANPVGLNGLEPLTKRRAFELVTPTAQGVQHQPQFAYAYEQSHQSGVPVQMQDNNFVIPSSSHAMNPSDTQLITPSKVLSPGRDMGLLLPSPIKDLLYDWPTGKMAYSCPSPPSPPLNQAHPTAIEEVVIESEVRAPSPRLNEGSPSATNEVTIDY